MAFPTTGGPRNCPVKGCPGRATTRMAMRVHFFHRHFQNTVIVLVEGNLSHPWCPQCKMMVPWRTLNWRHIATAQCAKGAKRKLVPLEEEDLRESSERAFQDYREPLETVILFKYLVRVSTAGDDDWMEVSGKLRKARKSWVRMLRILSLEGANPKVSGILFKAVVQAVLLFGT